MNRIVYSLIFLFSLSCLYGQKPLLKRSTIEKKESSSPTKLPPLPARTKATPTQPSNSTPASGIFSGRDQDWKIGAVNRYGMPTLIHSKKHTQKATSRSRAVNAFEYLNDLKIPLQIEAATEEFIILEENTDKIGQQHIKMQQSYQGIKVYGGEIWVHQTPKDGFNLLTGKTYPTPQLASTQPSIDQEAAIQLALTDLAKHTTVSTPNALNHPLYEPPTNEGELVIYHPEDNPTKERLAWELVVHPNPVHHWKYFIDAHTGEVLQHFSTICQLDHKVGRACEEATTNHASWDTAEHSHSKQETYSFNGPETTQVLDLNGNTKVISTYETGGRYYMLDITKPMFNASSSQLPNDPVGAIWTLNARNTSPARRLESSHITATNNNWQTDLGALGVSAHSNASITYDYYLNTFNRSSFNGRGGNITSFINVADENGRSMENAFWDGRYIYYGNGGNTFRELARSLDVAGHEISHGVVTSTANLEYQGESGAMNEAFADIFAVMITRDNWLIGEDVVNQNTFKGGALRNMADPHNGGSSLQQPGWQPKHIDEAFRGREDNGGVHINSGIINHAFYLHSVDSQMGQDIGANISKTEQIYYRALTSYLTARSGFRDLRTAVILSARDLYGANSIEVAAADRAFRNVGISSPSIDAVLDIQTPTPEEEVPVEIEGNFGRDFVIYTDEQSNQLYIADSEGNVLTDDNFSQPVKSKASVTDDGSFIVYVGQDNLIYLISIDWTTGVFKEDVISEEAIWRNVAISKDGRRIAAITDNTAFSEVDNIISVFDFGLQEWKDFELYNPTFTEGVSTATVDYADALEFNFSGESIMYDASNSIKSAFETEELKYWDIGFIKVWENDNNFWEQNTDNNIRKLFSGLPEDDSVGNPTFSKNSPDIIAFDYVKNFNNSDATDNVYYLLGANTLSRQIDTILVNQVLNFPNYSRTDEQLIFDAKVNNDLIIASVNLADNKISAAGNAEVLISQAQGAKRGVWFSNGIRSLTTSTTALPSSITNLQLAPNPFQQQLTIQLTIEQSQDFSIEIHNLLGQAVHQQNWSAIAGENTLSLSLPSIESGTYLLLLTSKEGVISRKVLKL